MLAGPFALKFPCRNYLVRGWLANRSEWRRRACDGVARPLLSLAHMVVVFPRADEVGGANCPASDDVNNLDGDDAKPSSWGRFGDRWLLIDFDRAWEAEDRGAIGTLYWGRQERLARRWMALPTRNEDAHA